MNILIFNWRDIKNPKSGGAEQVTLEHAKAWVKNGHKVTWFTSEFKGSKREQNADGINIVRRGNFLTVFFYAFVFYLFAGKKFDLVIDEIHGLPFFTPIFVKKPKIAFIHEVAGEIWDYMYPFPVNRIGKFIERLLYASYRDIKFITVSESTKKDLIKKGIKEKNINVILNGLTNNPLTALPNKEKVPTFIFVSRIVKMKGIEDVIRSFFYILRDLKAANLWIVGEGEENYVEELKEMAKTYAVNSKIKFFGRVTNDKKLELMKRAHILLHASVKEGWGLVVIEAASMATPSVVYNVSGLRDSVKNGKTGIVLSENSAKEMAKESIGLIKDKKKYQSYQINCLEWAKSLTWEKATQKSVGLIEQVAGL